MNGNALTMERFQGGKSFMLGAGVVGLIGLALTAVGLFTAPEVAYHAYLIAFLYWLGISLGAIIWLSICHVTGARWMTILRRPWEAMGTTVALFAILFLPIALGMEHLFDAWIHPSHEGPEGHLAHHIEHKAPYLNVTFFLIRAAIYFLVWIAVSHLQAGWSRSMDDDGNVWTLARLRRLGGGSLPFLTITVTFAAVDWIMSLQPLWFSTIFGVYYFAGGFLAMFCVTALVIARSRGPNLFGDLVTTHHLHNIGKLMLAFTAFWAYIAFSQYLLIWVANIPEEVTFFTVRTQGAWKPVALLLVIAHFVIPFFLLLSRDIKLRTSTLSVLAIWQLVLHYVDVYWLVMPAIWADGWMPHWTHLTAFVGVGGVAIAYAIFRLRGRYAVPVRDPYLQDSLAYVQP